MMTVKSKDMVDKVSVVIPVYNNEVYLRKCLDSVVNQTFSNLEIIIVDDGSKDASGEISDSVAELDSRITVIHQKNSGTAAARNAGLDRATGEYLTFVDGDDYLAPDYIERLYLRAKQGDLQMVICGLTYVTPQGQILKCIVPDEYIRFKKEEWILKISAAAAHFYKREMWEQYHIRFYPGERGEDMPVALFFGAVCQRIGILAEAGYYYVQHEGSAMHNFKGLNTYRLPYVALEKMIQKINNVGINNSEEFHELFVMRILATFVSLAKGAKKKEIGALVCYIDYIIERYYPNCYKNSLLKLFSKVNLPMMQKVAVWMMIQAKRTKLLNIFLKIMCR